MPLSDVLDSPLPEDFDPMSGDSASGMAAAAAKPTLGVPANNSVDQAEQARIQNNQAAAQAGLPQSPAPPPQAAPAPPPQQGAPPGVANAQPPSGVGAYGAGGAQPGGPSPIAQLAMRQAMQGGQSRPAGFVPQSQSVETSPVRPGAEQALSDYEQSSVDVARQSQRLAIAQGEALAPLQQKQAKETQDFLANTKASLAEHVQKIQQLTDNASKAAHEEPEDFWGGADMGKRIPRTIGMALMAFGHGLNPNAPNPMEYMTTMVKQAAEKQKAKADAAKGDLEREGNLYALMKQKFGDDQSAMEATQMLQKRAVLDQIDAHFTPPAQKTWGGEKTPEDPYAGLSPNAALGLAKMRQSLAQDILSHEENLDKIHVGKVQMTQKYREAQPGGPGNVLAGLRAGAEATKLEGEINTGGRAAEAGVRKGEAEASLEEGKAAAATGGGPELKKFEQAAKELHSIGIWTNPTETVSQHFQGTEGQQNRLALDAYNSMVVAKYNETHKGLARSNPKLFEKGLHTYEIDPDTATPTTIQRQVNQAREKLFTGAPAEGGAGGTVDTAGEGEAFE